MDGKYFMCPGTYLDCEQTVLWCVVIQAIKSTLETTIKQRGAARKAAFSTQPCSVCLLHSLLVQALCSPFPGNTLLTTQMTITVSHWMILCWFLRRKISWRKAAMDLPRLACSEERALCLGMSSLRPKHSQCMGKGAHPLRCWVPLVPKSACCLKRSGRPLRFASFLPPSLNRDPQPGFTALWVMNAVVSMTTSLQHPCFKKSWVLGVFCFVPHARHMHLGPTSPSSAFLEGKNKENGKIERVGTSWEFRRPGQ